MRTVCVAKGVSCRARIGVSARVWRYRRIVRILVVALIIATPALAERTIRGVAKDARGQPMKGLLVQAFDSDSPDKDDFMGSSLTNSRGEYTIRYPKKKWDSGSKWRPDILLKFFRTLGNSGAPPYKLATQTGVRSDHPVRTDLKIDVTVPDPGGCPVPAKFDTTGRWRGCKCPDGMHKRWLDAFKKSARCARGDSPRKKCRQKRGYKWVGIDSRYGTCVKASNLINVHRHAYFEFFKKIRKGITTRSLPAWFVAKYDAKFPKVKLADIRWGISMHSPSPGITDCKKIYFAPEHNPKRALRSEAAFDAASAFTKYLVAHEIAHSNQCMGLRGGGGSTKRDRYADMWFSQLPGAILKGILSDGKPMGSTVHDAMPMEKAADRKAAELGFAKPTVACPGGTFNTRSHRGCKCAGRKKFVDPVFKSRARCVR